tara:strand:- start:28 stop:774 length:747 start_codon:yes stop_codon:yes gene_type:complete
MKANSRYQSNQFSPFFVAGLFVTAIAVSSWAPPTLAQAAEAVSRTEFDSWMLEISNWGRWGNDDELDTLNLITDQKRTEAAALVREGTTVSLSLFANKQQDSFNANPFQHNLMRSGFGGHEVAGDIYSVQYHGFAHSHMDGLSHFAHKGQMYNGFSVDNLQADGSDRLGIHHAYKGVFTRGILVDIPWLRGVDYLEPGTAITVADLEAWSIPYMNWYWLVWECQSSTTWTSMHWQRRQQNAIAGTSCL